MYLPIAGINVPSPYLVKAGDDAQKCEAKPESTKADKIAFVANKALKKLSGGMAAHEVANYIRQQSIGCFGVTAQSDRQDDILASMKKSICDNKYPGVTLAMIKDVANNLGKNLEDKC